MNPLVYEYEYQGSAPPLVDLFAPLVALKSTELWVVAALAGAVLLLATCLRERRGSPVPSLARWPLLAPSLLLFATYSMTWSYVDEVSINLEHSYNLYHFGKFSFSPVRMLDGTVEYAYYLLLTPFAWSPGSLIVANFGLGLLIAWGHLWMLSRLLADAKLSTRLALLLLFSVNYPLVAMLASGFGNSLASLAILGSLMLQFSGRTAVAAMVASALPLLRPDAILYSYALLFAFATTVRAELAWPRLTRWAWPVAALAGYLTLFRITYGDWVPTPIAFKSVYPSMVTLGAIQNTMLSVLIDLATPLQIVALQAVIASALFKADPRIRVIRRLLLPMTAVFLFYSLTRNVLGDFSGDSYARYWIGFSLALFLCECLVLANLASKLSEEGRYSYTMVFGRLGPVLVVLLMAAGIAWNNSRTDYRNRTDLGYAGQVTAGLVPADLSVATSELNTFGLMLDREVVDLWGYTNPLIAQSRMLNGARIRSNPAAFLSIGPDLYFAYTEPGPASDTEQYLATFHHMLKDVNLLGDMAEVLARYDVVLVRHPQRHMLFLVRREAVATLRESLARHGYAAIAERAIDMRRFKDLYDRQVMTQFRF